MTNKRQSIWEKGDSRFLKILTVPVKGDKQPRVQGLSPSLSLSRYSTSIIDGVKKSS